MGSEIYIRLLNEGTDVFRRVLAAKIQGSLYRIHEFQNYNPEDEEWEFLPWSLVIVEKQCHESRKIFVAVREHK